MSPAYGEIRSESSPLMVPQISVNPEPTQIRSDEIRGHLYPQAIGEINLAQIKASNNKQALPIIAGVAIAAVAWCVSGAFSSVPTSILADIANRGEGGGDYVRNAVYGCAVGNVGSWAWKVIPSSIKQKVLKAVVRFYLEHIRK